MGLRQIWESRGARKDAEAFVADQWLFLARPPFASLDAITDDLRSHLAQTDWMTLTDTKEAGGSGIFEGYRHFVGVDPAKSMAVIGIGLRAGGDSPDTVDVDGLLVRTSGARAKVVARAWLLARGYEILRESPGM